MRIGLVVVGAALLAACGPSASAADVRAMPFGIQRPFGRMHMAKAKAPETKTAAARAPNHALEAVKDFMMGAVSGAVASFSVFPIDMAKTRIQDQRVVAGAELLYKNGVQTIARVFKEEGIVACYNGVVPVIVGSAPEAALQLGGNNNARAWFCSKLKTTDTDLPFWAEILSGSFGGGLQVVATNPMERVKIIQQVCSSLSLPHAQLSSLLNSDTFSWDAGHGHTVRKHHRGREEAWCPGSVPGSRPSACNSTLRMLQVYMSQEMRFVSSPEIC
jgi:hypothetical protein